jgi:elongator complex protein 3
MNETAKTSREILKELEKTGAENQMQLNKIKLKIARKYRLKKIPTNIELSNYAGADERKKWKNLLTIKPVRTISGVAPIAIMTKPHKCPHGKCIYCPGGVGSAFGDVPQSYTGKEPATRRAIRNKFDPYMQAFNRLEQYAVMNKTPDKAEIIIMGGTFPSLPIKYQDKFVMHTFKALNDFSKLFYKKKELNHKKFGEFFEIKENLNDEKRTKRIHRRILAEKAKGGKNLQEEQKKNETAKIRCVSLTIETRPDWCGKKEINQMLKLGCTRAELGIQTIYDSILKKSERGHTVKDSINATKLLKDTGFKINYHLMPGLPGSDAEKDAKMFKTLFSNQDFKPDMLKIYPCMVIKGTKLHKLFKEKKYTPLKTEEAAELIIKLKKIVPKYVRIMRVQRDIPTAATEAGAGMTNLRQHISEIMKKRGIKCRCIRCREIGRQNASGKIEYNLMHYNASDGTEFFISAEIKDALLGFCRLRFPPKPFRKEINQNTALIRELHVFGEAAGIGEKNKKKTQHKGIGRNLMNAAEDVSKMYYKKKIAVISGIGAREYYKKLGYKKEGAYMTKRI